MLTSCTSTRLVKMRPEARARGRVHFFLPNMPAKVIFTSNTHPVRSFMGAKSNIFLALRGKNRCVHTWGIMPYTFAVPVHVNTLFSFKKQTNKQFHYQHGIGLIKFEFYIDNVKYLLVYRVVQTTLDTLPLTISSKKYNTYKV